MKSPTYILGINESHGATACLLKNGEIVACVSEERFTKIKSQGGFPKKSIEYCLNYAKIKTKDLESVNLSFTHPITISTDKNSKNFSTLSSLSNKFQEIFSFNPVISRGVFNIREFVYKSFFYRKFQTNRIDKMARQLRITPSKIHPRDHQTCHAYSAYYSAPKKDFSKSALVITCDGSGDFVCSRVFTVRNNIWKEIASTPNINSIGMLYYCVTKYLGMKPNEHEYKVMGLAPYINPKYSLNVLRIFEAIYKVDGLQINANVPHVSLERFLEKKLKGVRFDMVASGLQTFTENILKELISNAIRKTGIHDIYLAGGVFMNVKANMILAELPEVKNVFVMPSSADESTAIGAAYVGLKDKNSAKPLNSIYLGPEFSDKEVRSVINKMKKDYPVKMMKNPKKEIAALLAQGKIVARFSGRMEFGQRALGNRSILTRADNMDVIKTINEKIKGRDFWMPFAPVILKERVKDYLQSPKVNSPYMMFAYKSTGKARKELIAGLHSYDLTTRPQIVSSTENPEYYAIIKEFEKLTGIGGMLNTSFNLHGFPIACTPEDAYFTFKNSDLNYLAIERYLVTKNNEK